MYVKQESAGTEKRVAEQKLIRSDQIRSSEGGPGELCSEQKDGEEKGWPERAVHLGGCRERRRRTIRFLILLARSLTHSDAAKRAYRGAEMLSSSGGAFAFLSHGNEEPAAAAAWQREEDGEGTDLACLISSLWSSGPTDRRSCEASHLA